MIDTIVLLLPSHYFTITQLNKFTPNAQFVYSHALLRAVQNPLKQELKNGIYKPRLTLLRRADMQGKQDVMLKIECSLPNMSICCKLNKLLCLIFHPREMMLLCLLH